MAFRPIMLIHFVLAFHSLAFAKSAGKCTGADMKEAMHFLSDYLTCTAGDTDTCNLMTESMKEGLRASGQLAGYDYLRRYSGSKLLKYSELTLLNSKKYASDSGYSKSVQQQWGGKDIDIYARDHGGDYSKALEKTKERFQHLETKLKSATVDKERVALRTELAEVKRVHSHLDYRNSVTKQNAAVLKNTMNDIVESNRDILTKIDKLDRQLGALDGELMERSAAMKESSWAAKKELEAKRKELIQRLTRLDSSERNFVNAYNDTLSAQIEAREKQIISETDSLVKKRMKETVATLEREKLTAKPAMTTATPRLDIGVRNGDILGADLTAANNPAWAREARLAALREFPGIVKNTISKNPDLLNDFDKLKEALSEAEHERWREWRQKNLIDTYENRRIKNPEKYKDIKFPLDKDGKAVAGAKLTEEQRQALNLVKPDWTNGDVPWSKLADEYKHKTRMQIDHALEKFAFWDATGRMRPLARFFASRPVLAKWAGKAIRVGPGLMLELGMFYFDWDNLSELAIETAMATDPKVADYVWSITSPRCRRPEDTDLKTENAPGEYAPWLCQCKTDLSKLQKVAPRCTRPLDEMTGEERELCMVIRADGRNRDLVAAKKFQELEAENDPKKEMLRGGLSCNVMKNYPSHCNWATDDLTDQGIYYMNIISKENLYSPVADLCPDVCEHWMQVAARKAEELSRLDQLLKLPKNDVENNPPAECKSDCGSSKCNADGTPLGPAPDQGQERLQWETCQKVISCSPSKISVKPRFESRKRLLERYEIQLDPTTAHVRDVAMITSTRGPSGGQSYLDRLGFRYRYDEQGELVHIDVHDIRENKLRESIDVGDILPKFKEGAYNATSNLVSTAELPRRILGINLTQPKTWTEEVLGRRIEVGKIVEQAIEYCCQQGSCVKPSSSPGRDSDEDNSKTSR